MDYQFIKGEENEPIQNALFQNYHTNLTKYPDWQRYLRQHRPPVLIVGGKTTRY
ncbi:hypothetical protein ACRQ5D_32905 [Mucilaginibacter sp. P25]|uniref:hypothetical protein n=1 Tax=Mucilaginibacter sp. P25 TaxID=3423945 RepID=UPI003D79CB99